MCSTSERYQIALRAEDLCTVVVLDPGQARLIALGETLDDQRASRR